MWRLGPRPGPGRRIGDGGQRETLEVVLHVLASLFPDGQQNTLSFVIT